MNMKLKAKFILPTVVIILACLSVTALYIYEQSTKAFSTVVVEKARTNVTSLLSIVDLWVDGALNQAATLAATDELVESLKQGDSNLKAMGHTQALLKDIVARYPNFDNILYINTKGIVVGATTDSLIGATLTEREYFKKAVRGVPFISDPVFNDKIGSTVFVIAVPVRNEGVVIGIVAVGIKINAFSEQFVKPLDSPVGSAFITTTDGLTLAHPDAALINKFNLIVIDRPNGASDVHP
jgi:methyl-accepting chemotaxis protein